MYSLKEKKPEEGIPVSVLFKENSIWYSDVAYFCDGDFFRLAYDPNLGILRKEYVTQDVRYWTEIPAVECEGLV